LRQISACVAMFLFGGFLFLTAAPQQKKKAPAKSTTVRKPAAKKPATQAKAGSNSSKKRASSTNRRTRTYSRSRSRGPKPVVARRSYGQQRPTSERFGEIQRALAAKGFYEGDPSGVWDAKSTEALRRFQAEQNLPATGKITSLSLIALGLGPKRGQTETAQRSQP
jgi:peptidoglycan hydrolase-like protein with peptidoglycan-binding domain